MGHHSISPIAFHWYDACLAGPPSLSLQKHPHCNTVGQNVFLKEDSMPFCGNPVQPQEVLNILNHCHMKQFRLTSVTSPSD